jgi:peptide deformylase
MAIRTVLQFPDKRLRVRAQLVRLDAIGDELRALARDMLETMYDEPGIGLAAPQVGEPVRLVVIDTSWTDEAAERQPIVALNPEILAREGEITWTEGCLSVPDFSADVERAARVRVRWFDLDGAEHQEDAEGLRAVCFQHELDHLDGILFIDRISRLKRELYERRRKKALRRGEAEGAGGEPVSGTSL